MSGIKIDRRLIRGGKRKGKLSSKWQATVSGGPHLAAQLRKLGKVTQQDASMEGAATMGRAIADEWATRVPVLDRNYQRALEDPKAVVVRRNKDGAGGAVGPARLADLEDNEQPMAYSSRLEWGDSARSPQPSAYPAFAAVQESAVASARDVMEKIVMTVAES